NVHTGVTTTFLCYSRGLQRRCLSHWRLSVAETDLFVSGFVSSASGGNRRSATAASRTHTGVSALDSFAVVCSGDLRRRLVLVHTRFYRCAASSPKSVGSALALAPADFVLCLGFHRAHAFILPGGARQSVGIVSGFLS